MTFRISALPYEPFSDLFELSDDELAARGAARRVVTEPDRVPCRVSLIDAAPGEEVLLAPYLHLDVATPYRGGGAIYVRRDARRAVLAPGEIALQQRRRLLSVRAYDARGWMLDADVAPGAELAPLIERLLADPDAAYLHVHNAKHGCYACRVDRA